MKHITIKDIAKELGISKSTVSRALSSDSQNVSQDTIRKVMDAAERMGYRKNAHSSTAPWQLCVNR